MEISLSKLSYSKDEDIELQIDFKSNLDLLKKTTNINVNISRIDKQRNYFVLGFGHSPETEQIIKISKQASENWVDGLYMISGVKLITGEGHESIIQILPDKVIGNLFFWYSKNETVDLSHDELSQKINQLNYDRGQFMNAELTTPNVTDTSTASNFNVIIFGVGCLVHSSQVMEGYIIHPLKKCFDYTHMLNAVNSFIISRNGTPLTEVESIKNSFNSSTPLFAIEFKNVTALDHADAGYFCSQTSEKIFTILAYEKGQRPTHFSSLIQDKKTNEIWQAFHFPGYRGNLVSDFNPSSTADTIERILPKIDTSPWFDLIMRTYADAESEQNQNYACLKYWSILEMIAKKEITDNTIELKYPNGDFIYNNGGQKVTTKSALGKVYKLVFDSDIPPLNISNGENGTKLIFESHNVTTNSDDNTNVINLWDTLSALYEIRNSTAHSGAFDSTSARNGGARQQLAAQLWDLEYQTFARHIGSVLKVIVSKELNNA